MVDRVLRRIRPVVKRSAPAAAEPSADEKQMRAMRRLEKYYEGFPPRTERIGEHMATLLGGAGLTGGRMLEIGGRENPYGARFGASGWTYLNMDLDETGPDVIKGDITNCPEIPDGSFDAIISVDVFEHIKEPWKAAKEIGRLLRPGGFTYHSTLFSWRYHPCPVDFWRYTPDALQFLFEDLDVLRCDFDAVERRRNLIGKGKHRVAPDAFGGWREHWRVFYAGVKPLGTTTTGTGA